MSDVTEEKPKTIAVLGLGNWGTALAQHFASNGFNVLGWCREPEIIESINSENKNCLYFPNIALSSNLRATSNIEETLNADFLVLVVASQALREVLPLIKDLTPNKTIVSAIKGLCEKDLSTPLQIAAKHLPQIKRLSVISGPTFAKDIIIGRPCGIVAASKLPEVSNEVATILKSSYMRVYTSEDPLGVELGGISKNVIALAAGVCDGLNLGDSARAGIITRGLAEILRIAEALGAKRETIFGLSGLGDLVMTASCDTSRNRTVGLRLGRGEKLNDIISSLGSVAEGVKTAPLILRLAEKHGIDASITTHVVNLLEGKEKPEEMVTLITSKPIKAEF